MWADQRPQAGHHASMPGVMATTSGCVLPAREPRNLDKDAGHVARAECNHPWRSLQRLAADWLASLATVGVAPTTWVNRPQGRAHHGPATPPARASQKPYRDFCAIGTTVLAVDSAESLQLGIRDSRSLAQQVRHEREGIVFLGKMVEKLVLRFRLVATLTFGHGFVEGGTRWVRYDRQRRHQEHRRLGRP